MLHLFWRRTRTRGRWGVGEGGRKGPWEIIGNHNLLLIKCSMSVGWYPEEPPSTQREVWGVDQEGGGLGWSVKDERV